MQNKQLRQFESLALKQALRGYLPPAGMKNWEWQNDLQGIKL
jgi:hypothetical protein